MQISSFCFFLCVCVCECVCCLRCPLLQIYYNMFLPTGKTPISLRGNDSMVCAICGMTQANASEVFGTNANFRNAAIIWLHLRRRQRRTTSAMRFLKKEINILFHKHFVGAPCRCGCHCGKTLTSGHQMILVIMSVI